MDCYSMIFKRKSFHLFKDIKVISDEELNDLYSFIETVKPLDESIGYRIRIVEEEKTTCKRGAQYCLQFYSEEKGNYLRNIGYIGEQIDLYLASKNIGTLWFGIGKPDEIYEDDLKFVIMIAMAKVDEASFRKDMFKARRKELSEIWSGDILPFSSIIRYAPSACNTQPWMVENDDGRLTVFRYRKPGKRGIMPSDRVTYYNRIDMGIFLFFLETCLKHDGYEYVSEQYYENDDESEKVSVAQYSIKKL